MNYYLSEACWERASSIICFSAFSICIVIRQLSRCILIPTLILHSSTWLWNIARGISGEEVESRLLSKSHGSGKTFPGPKALKTIASVRIFLTL